MSSPFWFEVFKATTPPGVLMQALRDGLVPDPNQVRHGVTLLTSYLRSHHGRPFCDAPWYQGMRDKGDPSLWESVAVENATPSTVAAALIAMGADPYAMSKEDSVYGVDAFGAATALGLSDWLSHTVSLLPPSLLALERWNQSSSPVCLPSESTPLPWLNAWAQAGNVNMLSALVGMGLNPDGRDFKDRTALFFVSTPAEVQVLVDAGADREPLDKAGQSPQRLWDNKDPQHVQQVSALLKQSGQETEKALQAAAIARMRDHLSFRMKHISREQISSPKNTLVKDWLAMLEVSMAPVHTWRLPVTKGQIKGEWSLMGTLSMCSLLQQNGLSTFGWETLLARQDILTPDNHCARKGLSEKGVLALALWLQADAGFYASSKYSNVKMKDKPDADYLVHAQRLFEVSDSLGDPAWLLSPSWLSAACESTLALRKSKSERVADNLVSAWYKWANSIHVAQVGCASDFGKHPGHAFVREAQVSDVLAAFENVHRAGIALPTSAGALLIKMAPHISPEEGFVWAACMAWASKGAWLANGSPNGSAGSAIGQGEFTKAMVAVLDKGIVIPPGFRPDDALWSEWEKLVPNHVHALRALKLERALQPVSVAPPRIRM